MFRALAALPGLDRGAKALLPALGGAFRAMATSGSDLKSVLSAAIPAEQVG